MVESTTQHYGWTKPEITKSSSTWGGFLNSDLDSIDSLVFANQQAIVPIGAITMFGGTAMPANWTLCAGQALDTTTYAKLFAVIGYIYGGSGASFNVPNLVGKFPSGATDSNHPGATGGEAYHTLITNEIAVHAHTVTDPQHYHNISQGSSATHTHGDYGHGHTASGSQDAHTHNALNVMRFVGSGGTQGVGAPLNTSNVNATTDGASANGVYVTVNTGYANLAPSGTGITNTDYASTRINYTDAVGGGAPHNNMPPFVTINFIMRYQ